TKDLATAKVLHEAGGDISARSNRGSTLLHEAARANKPEIVEWLITLGLDVNALDSSKETPLHKAALNGHHDVVIILLSSGAQVNIQGLLGQTPLHLALYDRRRPSIIQVLRSHGADMHCIDGYGKSSLDWIKSDRKLLESLESLPAESSVADLAAQTCCL